MLFNIVESLFMKFKKLCDTKSKWRPKRKVTGNTRNSKHVLERLSTQLWRPACWDSLKELWISGKTLGCLFANVKYSPVYLNRTKKHNSKSWAMCSNSCVITTSDQVCFIYYLLDVTFFILKIGPTDKISGTIRSRAHLFQAYNLSMSFNIWHF